MENNQNNSQIARNTFYLYVRMILILLITLYTSRVVMQQLGIIDFGIYNVVGSLVLMFSFIRGALTSSTSRYLAFEIGMGKAGDVRKVFCMSINIHVLFAFFVLFCCETIGVWYFYNRMNIPEERETASFVVFQLSNIAAIFSILSVPYQAIIVAYEKMKSFAYLSLFDVALKLVIAISLSFSPGDKMVFYSLLLLLQSAVIQFFYMFYCLRNFAGTEYKLLWDKVLFKEMLSFSGWSIGSYLSTAFVGQCVNLILNMFFGPVVNAARAIAFQVQAAVNNFVSNFQVALNPQMIKSYANGDIGRVNELVIVSMKFSFSLVFLLAYPLLCSVNYILGLWLVEVPENTDIFVCIIMLSSVLIGISNSLSVTAEAANRLKLFNGVTTPYYLSSLLVCYICFKVGCPPYTAFVVILIYDIVGFIIKLVIVRKIIGMELKPYIVFLIKITIILLGAFFLALMTMGTYDNSWGIFVLKTIACSLYSIPTVLFVVLTKSERKAIWDMVTRKLSGSAK